MPPTQPNLRRIPYSHSKLSHVRSKLSKKFPLYLYGFIRYGALYLKYKPKKYPC